MEKKRVSISALILATSALLTSTGAREAGAAVPTYSVRVCGDSGALDSYAFGDVQVNLRSCQVSKSGKALDFSSKEFELLRYFLCHIGETLSRDRLLEVAQGFVEASRRALIPEEPTFKIEVLRARIVISVFLMWTSIRCVLPSSTVGANPKRYWWCSSSATRLKVVARSSVFVSSK